MAVVKPKNLTVNFEGAWKELEESLSMLGKFYGDIGRCAEATMRNKMDDLEKKHKNLITLKKCSDKEIVDYCIKKSVEARMEVICLKEKLRGKRNRVENPARFEQLINEMINKIYQNGTYGDIKGNKLHKHIAFSNCDIYMIDRLEEMKIMLPQFQEMIPKNVKGIVRVDEKQKKPERKLFKMHLVCLTADNLRFVFDWGVTDKKRKYLEDAFYGREEISWHGLKMRIVELNIDIS